MTVFSRRKFLKSSIVASSLPLAASKAMAEVKVQDSPAIEAGPIGKPSAPIVIKTRRDFTPDVYRRVCWNHTPMTIAPETLTAIDASRAEFLQFLKAHPELNIYGVNIHSGDWAKKRLSKDELNSYLRQGLNTGVSFGDPLPDRIVRGIVMARLVGMVSGNSASSSGLTKHICKMLDNPVQPKVPREGQGGAGEVCPLGILFDNVPREIELGVKEPMTLINGHPTATSLCLDGYLRSVGTIKLCEEIFALAADGLQAPDEHFSAQLEACWDDPDEVRGLQTLRGLIKGSPTPRRNKQSKVVVRDLPLMLGAAYKAQNNAKAIAEKVLCSAHDNPLWVPTDQASKVGVGPFVCSNGSYHTQIGIVANDELSRAYADLTVMGLGLVQAYYSDPEAMPDQENNVFGDIPMNAADWADEARTLAVPSIMPPPQYGQNDMPSPYMRAWNKVDRLERVLIGILTQVATMASQSIYMRGDLQTSPALTPTLQAIRACTPPVTPHTRRTIGHEMDILFRTMLAKSRAYSAADPEDRSATVMEMKLN